MNGERVGSGQASQPDKLDSNSPLLHPRGISLAETERFDHNEPTKAFLSVE